MAGCCRGRPKFLEARAANECKTFEAGGARTVIRVVATAQGLRLAIPTPSNGFMDLGSFVAAYKCDGATARLLKRNLPTIQQALASDPAIFASYRSGISVTDLIRVASQVTKQGARTHASEIRPNPSR
jgi:hypothetical protein